MANATIVKRLQDLMRQDAGINGDAQRIEQMAWLIFLKVYDAKDKEREFYDDFYKSGIPEDLRWKNWAEEKKYEKVDSKYLLKGGELLFAWSGTPGTSFGAHIWKKQVAVLNQHIFKLEYNESILPKPFYLYALNQRVDELIKLSHGA